MRERRVLSLVSVPSVGQVNGACGRVCQTCVVDVAAIGQLNGSFVLDRVFLGIGITHVGELHDEFSSWPESPFHDSGELHLEVVKANVCG